MLLIAAGSLWLFLAAIPAFADGGPHIASENSGVSSLTTDSCAGCHRVHTAQAPMLLKVDEEDLCLSCHGAAVTGATTDVESGLQYAVDDNDTNIIGALRSGGFDTARIGDPAMFTYLSSRGVSKNSKVQVASTGSDVTSAHLPDIANLTGELTQPGIAWGNGANGSGAGPAATIGCGSCHNPHGNGAYRILNPIPAGTGISAAWTIPVVTYGTPANTYVTLSSHGLLNGDKVIVSAMTGGGNAGTTAAPATVAVVSDTSFTLAGVTGGTGTGGIVTRVGGVKVLDDVTTDPTVDTRNYTVIQTAAGTTGTPAASATLTATEAQAFSATAGDYFHYKVPWNGGSTVNPATTNNDAPNGIAYGTSGAAVFNTGFNQQMTAWCSSCHTRYWAWTEPVDEPGETGAAYDTSRPGDGVFTYQHRTRGASGRACTTCHVSHGSNAIMDGPNSSDYLWPDQVDLIGTPGEDGAGNANSRLLKVDNRGTCVLCHDPTGTLTVGQEFPTGAQGIPAP
jgi:predicted CXXCH cytochrome family protein